MVAPEVVQREGVDLQVLLRRCMCEKSQIKSIQALQLL